MIVGFSGTREGTTYAQGLRLRKWLEHPPEQIIEARHGVCVGADAEFHAAIRGIWRKHVRVVGHPCDIKSMRADIDDLDEVMPEKPPLERNRDIVAASGILLACPAGPEVMRSGTWATVRECRRARKPVVLFWPDGIVTEEQP